MKLLANPEDINHAIQDCMESYSYYEWAVAWVGSMRDFEAVSTLLRYPGRIRRLLVGTHFYQTSPDFIEHYRKNSKVRFMPSTSDIFHPKVYWFENNEDDWACIVGSANFTKSAMQNNAEACIFIDSNDKGNDDFRRNMLSFIDTHWSKARPGVEIDLKDYQKKYGKRLSQTRALGSHVRISRTKPRQTTEIELSSEKNIDSLLRASWRNYYLEVTKSKRWIEGEAGEQILVPMLKNILILWKKCPHYSAMNEEEHNNLLGTRGDYRWLGNMGAARKFQSKESKAKNIKFVSRALDEIPLDRRTKITSEHYAAFLKQWQNVDHGAIGIASRLLTMRRPDVFCSVNGRSQTLLGEVLGIRKITLDNYWSHCVSVLHQSSWWQAPRPQNAKQAGLWDIRMAIIDCLVYLEL